MITKTPYRHWTVVTDRDSIAWLTFDRADSDTNTLSKEMLEELDSILDDINNAPPKGLIILSGKPGGFIAGADVNEFTLLESRDQAYELIRRGQGVMDKIEAVPYPTLALIHGFCVGGGLELALACRYRIAMDDPQTKLGLPEVRLGIHPGFGGTVRLPRLIGPAAAMRMMLTGRLVSAYKARKLGLVDYSVPERLWKKSARDVIEKKPKKKRSGWMARTLNLPVVCNLAANQMRKTVAHHAAQKHYPAPWAMIELWERSTGNLKREYEAEASSVADLVLSPTSNNLVRAFFLQTRLKGLAKDTDFKAKRVHVIGGGAMGGAIAAWCALQGLQVTIQARRLDQLGQVGADARKLFEKKLKRPKPVIAAMDRLIPDPEGFGLVQADVVIEAIVENLEAKQGLLKMIEPRMRKDAVLASNTSSIPLEELAEALERPERLVGLHFFNPVAKMPLVEVVRSDASDENAVADAMAFVGSIRKLPLPVQSAPGFLVNRVLLPYLLEAVQMLSEGIPAEAIDRAAVDFGMPIGPVELADMVGLDICLSVGKVFSSHLSHEIPPGLEELVAQGHLGKKSGRGFYRYKKGKPIRTKHGKLDILSADIESRLIARLLNEAVTCLREGIVADPDLLDAGMIFGTGFAPFRGGPIKYALDEGTTNILKRLKDLTTKHGERFDPDAGWKDLPETL